MATLDPVKNFAKVTVSTGYTSTDTSIVLNGGEGAKLPDPASDGAFNLTWWNWTDYKDPSDDPNKEIVRVTARSTDTLTVTRGQEGTSATDKNTSGKTYLMLLGTTKKTRDDIDTALDNKAASGANSDITSLSGLTTPLSVSQGGTGASDAATARTNLGAGTMSNVSEDTTPQLGGDLDVNGHKIVSTSNGDIVLEPDGTGRVTGVYRYIEYRILDKDTAVATGTGVGGEFRVPRAMTVKNVGAYVDTASTSGTPTIDINEAGTSILSTKITIDENEKSSQTAATPPVVSDSSIAADAILTFDVDVAGTGTKGLVVWLEVIL